jgi:hypothetical protein
VPVPSAQQRYAALQWAAGMRGAADPDEAEDWMISHGYVRRDDDGGVVIIDLGIERADSILASLQDDDRPSAEVLSRRRRRTNVVLLVLAGLAVWWARRR